MLQKLFGFDPSTMTMRKEVIGGITTFLTMAYILAVNPTILSAAGMDAGAIFTTTCLSAVIATFVMAIYAKLPFALAPGMGLNAFFAFTVVLTMGYTWQFALTAVLIEGIIFILLTITGLRKHIVNAIPLVLRRAISPGIGLFIAFVGLKSAGIVTSSESTFITLGNMHEAGVLEYIWHFVDISLAGQKCYRSPAHRYSRHYRHWHTSWHHKLYRHHFCTSINRANLLEV